jgi:tetratricopeptide (TPR) repeat protein
MPKQSTSSTPNISSTRGVTARTRVGAVLTLLGAALALVGTGCSESNQPLKRKSGGKSKAVMRARPVYNPNKPGTSNAERSISQALRIKRGKSALTQQKPTLALTHLRQALATLAGSPRTAEIHLLMGRAFDMADQPQQAMVAYEKGVAVEPSNPAGHYLLARSYKAAKQLGRAYASIQRASSLAPKVLVYHFDRVTIELDLGKKQQGERSYRGYEKLRNDYIAQLKGGRDKKRLAAVHALGSVPSDPINIRALIGTLGAKSPALRSATALALADSDSKDPGLRKALSTQLAVEKDPTAQRSLRTALGKLPLSPQ